MFGVALKLEVQEELDQLSLRWWFQGGDLSLQLKNGHVESSW
jgi:hypothetical protein